MSGVLGAKFPVPNGQISPGVRPQAIPAGSSLFFLSTSLSPVAIQVVQYSEFTSEGAFFPQVSVLFPMAVWPCYVSFSI